MGHEKSVGKFVGNLWEVHRKPTGNTQKIGKICGNIRWNVVRWRYEACNALTARVGEIINVDQGNIRILGKSEGLNIFMMGTVTVEYNREPLPVMANPLSKMFQLSPILLCVDEKGVPREELLDILYGNGGNANLLGSLRAVVFRPCKILEGSGLPEHERIRTEGGVYRFDKGSLSMYIDAKDSKETARKAPKARDEDPLKRVCRLHQGEFMVQPAGEEQVFVIEVRYQGLYFQCLGAASHLMKINREHTELLGLRSAACSLCLHGERQIMKIDCLVAMKRSKDAMQVYDQAVTQYLEGQGLPPSEKMPKRFRTVNGQIHYISGILKDVKENLQEWDRVNGPHYCSCPAFTDCCQLLVYISERIDSTGVMLCCTLLSAKGKPLDAAGDLLKTTLARLHEAIRMSVRKGDLLIYYNLSQYLVTLNGISQERCLRIFEWIDRILHLWDGECRAKPSYQVMPGDLL